MIYIVKNYFDKYASIMVERGLKIGTRQPASILNKIKYDILWA